MILEDILSMFIIGFFSSLLSTSFWSFLLGVDVSYLDPHNRSFLIFFSAAFFSASYLFHFSIPFVFARSVTNQSIASKEETIRDWSINDDDCEMKKKKKEEKCCDFVKIGEEDVEKFSKIFQWVNVPLPNCFNLWSLFSINSESIGSYFHSKSS